MKVIAINTSPSVGREREAGEKLLARYRLVTPEAVAVAFPDLPGWARTALVAYHQSRVPILEHALAQNDGVSLRQLIDEAVEDKAFPPEDFGKVWEGRGCVAARWILVAFKSLVARARRPAWTRCR